MKALLFVFLFLCGVAANAQDSTIARSRFETFASQPAMLIKTTSIPVGEVGSYRLLKLVATEVATDLRSTALKLEGRSEGPVSTVEPTGIYIDSLALDSVILTLEIFLVEMEKKNLPSDVLLRYSTASDIQLTCYYERLYDRWDFVIDKIYQELRTHVPGTGISFTKKRLKELVSLLKGAKANW